MELENKYYRGWNIKQEYTKCKKPNCTVCSEGIGHGLYWYAYKRISGKLKRKYLGKDIPGDLDKILGLDDENLLKSS
jgi:hypothetical protein